MSRPRPPLKILHIASGDLWAGAEVQAYTLLCALRDNEDMQVAAILLNEGELARRLRARGIEVYIVPENTLNAWGILLELRKLMLAWQPNLIHTHRIKENILGSIANRLSRNVPSVRTVHGAGEHVPKGLRKIHKRILNYLDCWTGLHLQQKAIAVSQELAGKLLANFPLKHLVVIENGVDVDAVCTQKHVVEFRESMPHAIHVGIVGRLVPVKRVDIFLEMALLLSDRHANQAWQFHVFGDGPLKDSLIARTNELGIGPIVTFHGHRQDIIPCIAGLDVLVMCSDHEGLPMTILESMALQIRIVAHAVGGLSDALRDYRQGLLVAGHSANDYADAVFRLIRQSPTADPQPPMERFSARSNARAVARLYADLTAGSVPAN
ncbi:MAG TPA: glycosyltransferase [Spongiibacteraceae bacterium]|nr:glycosyltransferase [Spongiibacteraceae bacterium]